MLDSSRWTELTGILPQLPFNSLFPPTLQYPGSLADPSSVATLMGTAASPVTWGETTSIANSFFCYPIIKRTLGPEILAHILDACYVLESCRNHPELGVIP